VARKIGPFTYTLTLTLQGVDTHAETWEVTDEDGLAAFREESAALILEHLKAAASFGEFGARRVPAEMAVYHVNGGEGVTAPIAPLKGRG
jgi:hypothetical protein